MESISPPTIPHQAPPISLELSDTTSVASEIGCVNEYDLLLLDRKDKPLTIPCNDFFEESLSLLMKSSYNKVSDDVSLTD